jgi:hypothetical protein
LVIAGVLAGGVLPRGGPAGERRHSHAVEEIGRGGQVLTGVAAPALAAQPFAVDQVGAGQLCGRGGVREVLDSLAVQGFGVAPG